MRNCWDCGFRIQDRGSPRTPMFEYSVTLSPDVKHEGVKRTSHPGHTTPDLRTRVPIPHSPLPIPHSAFPIPHPPFPIPHSAFRIPHYLPRSHRSSQANSVSCAGPAGG